MLIKQQINDITNLHIHAKIIKLMLFLGFKVSEEGVCFGIGFMAAQATLLGEEGIKSFIKRLVEIDKIKHLDNYLSEFISTNVGSPKVKYIQEKKVELLAFLNGIFLYQTYLAYTGLSNNSKIRYATQCQQSNFVFEFINPVLLSNHIENPQLKMQEEGFCGCFNATNLREFLDKLHQHLIALPIQHPIIINLSSFKHATFIVYSPNIQKYHFFDANQLLDEVPILAQKTFNSPLEIIKYIAKGLTSDNGNGFCTDVQQNFNTISLSMAIWHFEEISKTNTNAIIVDLLDIYRSLTYTINSNIALWLACKEGYMKVVKFILESNNTSNNNKIDINYCYKKFTLLNNAIFSQNEEIVKILLEHGAQVNPEFMNFLDAHHPLHLAVKIGHIGIIKLLLQNELININICDENGNSPLMLAIKNINLDVVKLLLEDKSVAVNICNPLDPLGDTPLILAIKNGNLEIVKLLLNTPHGIMVNLANASGMTPLGLAASNGHLEIVKLLLEKGANLNDTNGIGLTSLQLAQNNNHVEVANLLMSSSSLAKPTRQAPKPPILLQNLPNPTRKGPKSSTIETPMR